MSGADRTAPAGLADLETAHAPGGLTRRAGARPQRRTGRWWAGLGLLAVGAAWWFVLTAGRGGPGPASAEAWRQGWGFVRLLLGLDSPGPPAFAQAGAWREAAGLAAETLAMSVLAAGLAGAGALATVAFAARTLTTGSFATVPRSLGRLVYVLTRTLYVLTRGVPDLVWALMIVFVVRPGVLAGALALAVHNFGVLGRLGADVVEDLDPAPLRSLRSAGAGNLQVLTYGALPQVLPQLLTFLLYRWEVIIRATAVVGFVAGAGLGYQLRLDLSFLRYTHVALVLAVYVVLVWAVDLAAAALRRLAR